MENIGIADDKIAVLSNGSVINKATYLRFRDRYSMQRIAQEFGVEFEELMDKLEIQLTLALDNEIESAPNIEFNEGEIVLVRGRVASGELLAKAKVLDIDAPGILVQLTESCKTSGLKSGHKIGVTAKDLYKI